jgi:hypothetical protein
MIFFVSRKYSWAMTSTMKLELQRSSKKLLFVRKTARMLAIENANSFQNLVQVRKSPFSFPEYIPERRSVLDVWH